MRTSKLIFIFIFSFAAGLLLINKISDLPAKTIGQKLSGAMEAFNFFAEQRTYPYAKLPTSKFSDAFKQKKSLRKGNGALGRDDNWREIGPHNIGGRTISLAINPFNSQTIYAGSAGGGLWRSYSGGAGADAWDNIDAGFPVMAVGAIAISPEDSNTMFIGTGEVLGYRNSVGGVSVRTTRGSYGIGILKTTDGGNSWSKSLDWSYEDQRGVLSLEINPQNSSVIYAGTSEGTYKSTDGGGSWTLVNSTIMTTDVLIHPINTNIVLIACGNLQTTGNGIYRSSDAGASWNKITSGLPSSYGGKALLSICQSSPDIIFASIGNGYWSGAGTWLCKSTDAGETWAVVSTEDYSTYQGWFAHFVVVHPNDPQKLLCAGVDVYKSTNGGQTMEQKSFWYKWYLWQTQPGDPEGPDDYSHADHHAFAVSPDNPNVVYLANDGGVFVTTDFGETFAGRNGGYQSTQFYNGFTSSEADSNYAMGGLQDNATAIYDGSVAWNRVIGGDGSWTAMSGSDVDVMYGSYQYLSIQKSENGGNYWDNISPPDDNVTGFIAPYIISPGNHNLIYAGASKVFKSTDGGNNWQTTNGGAPLSDNPAVSMAMASTDNNIVFVGAAPVNSSAGLFRTTDGGGSWMNITGSLPDRYLVDIEIDRNNENNVYIAYSGYGTDHLFKSTDGGDTWNSISNGLPDVPTSSVMIDPISKNYIYAGTDIGVFVSTDGGVNWSDFSEGMPEAVIISNLTCNSESRVIRASTHGNGVFERNLIDVPLGLEILDLSVSEFRLEQNFPNPFNPTTTIKYGISKPGFVRLTVYDILGREAAALVNETQSPGVYEVNFNAEDLTSGVYLYKIEVGNFSATKKLLLLK